MCEVGENPKENAHECGLPTWTMRFLLVCGPPYFHLICLRQDATPAAKTPTRDQADLRCSTRLNACATSQLVSTSEVREVQRNLAAPAKLFGTLVAPDQTSQLSRTSKALVIHFGSSSCGKRTKKGLREICPTYRSSVLVGPAGVRAPPPAPCDQPSLT